MAFIALVSQLYGPLNTVSSLPVEVLSALVSFDRVFEILDLEPLIAERPAAYPLTREREAPGVEVEGVWFQYPGADESCSTRRPHTWTQNPRRRSSGHWRPHCPAGHRW